MNENIGINEKKTPCNVLVWKKSTRLARLEQDLSAADVRLTLLFMTYWKLAAAQVKSSAVMFLWPTVLLWRCTCYHAALGLNKPLFGPVLFLIFAFHITRATIHCVETQTVTRTAGESRLLPCCRQLLTLASVSSELV